MYTNFKKLSQERRELILNAAMHEFAAKSYDLASTNEIIKKAEISKGILFHYFKNKKQLFLYLFEFAADKIKNEIDEKVKLSEKDLFKRLFQAVEVKIELWKQYPSIFRFIEVAYFEQSKEVFIEMQKKKEKYLGSSKMLLEGVDHTSFKDDVDVNQALKIIFWSIDGLGREFTERLKQSPTKQFDYGAAIVETNQVLLSLKALFYK